MTALKKIILHVGLPKTGSSALQVWADDNRVALRGRDIDYPDVAAKNGIPNHHLILRHAIMSDDFDRLQKTIEQTPCSTLFLSSEGLSNHLYDFTPGALARFRATLAPYRVTVVIMLRNVGDWVRSYHAQAVMNPPSEAYDYATPLELDAFMVTPRVRRLMDHNAVLADVSSAFEPSQTVVVDYDKDWFAQVNHVLGIGSVKEFDKPKRVHVSVPPAVVELMRQVNGLGIDKKLRNQFQALLQRVVKSTHSILISAEQSTRLFEFRFDELQHVLSSITPKSDESVQVLDDLRQNLMILQGMEAVQGDG